MKNEKDLAHNITSTLVKLLPEKGAVLHAPCFQGNEWQYVKECLDTGWVSSVGKYVDEFEAKLAAFTGVKRAVAVVNGTAALHIALKICGVSENHEVLIPSLTFVATANAVVYCNAVPHFIDCEETTLGVDPKKLDQYLKENSTVKSGQCFNRKTGRLIKALVVMHTFGHPVDLDPIVEVARKYQIELVEDAAESLGSYYKGLHTGHWGRTTALSFNGNKIITTGGGGAILTNDETLGNMAKHLTTTAKIPHRWEFIHDQVGYNYRLPNINAALGCAQLENLVSFVEKKRHLAKIYNEAFEQIKGVKVFKEASFAKSNYWLNALLLDKPSLETRDAVLEQTQAAGLQTRPVWRLMTSMPHFKNCPQMDLSVAKELEQRIICLPSSPSLESKITS